MREYTPDSVLFETNWSLPSNPFPFIGADDYKEEEVLSLFEIEKRTTMNAFSLQNTIIEGSFGTGKTMLLKAIYAFHYSRMIVDISECGKAKVIPVYIKFSDLPHGIENVYKEIMLLIYKSILDTRYIIPMFLQDASWFEKFKLWLVRLKSSGSFKEDKRYTELNAGAVTKRVSQTFSIEGAVGFEWLNKLGGIYEKKYENEMVQKATISINDIEELFKNNFSSICDKILLLIDEVDRLPFTAFSKDEKERYSIYETFTNQLRTSRFIAYKIAVYPKTESSKQVESSRVGTRVRLGFNAKDEDDFISARDFFYRILRSYLSFCAKKDIKPESFFWIYDVDQPKNYVSKVRKKSDREHGDALEQLIFGSNGIVRRFINLAGQSMMHAVEKVEKRKRLIVSKFDVYSAMRLFGKDLIERLPENQRALVDRVAFYCLSKKVFRLKALTKEEVLNRVYDSTKQDNVLYPILDPNRKGTNYIFEFDYCYCIYRNIPTHYYLNSQEINNSRSLENGRWVVVPKNISEELLKFNPKTKGVISRYFPERGFGFVSYLDDNELYFHISSIMYLKGREITPGLKVAYGVGSNYQGRCAIDIRLL